MEITVFTSDNCVYCKQVKEYLNNKNVSFAEKNVSTDLAARKELMSKGFMGVPVIYVGDEIVHGFDKAKLDDLLK